MSPRSLCACITERVWEAWVKSSSHHCKKKIYICWENYTHCKLESYISIISISTDNVEMTENNLSLTIEFILIGFTDHPQLKTPLFLVFFTIYLITMVGNLSLVALIVTEHHLHTPMYIFLGNLALMDPCCFCAITPKMLENFFSKDRMISLYECIV